MCRMGAMMRFALLLTLTMLLPIGCAATPEKDPQNLVTAQVDKEFASFRPVALAVLKSDAPANGMRTRTRKSLSQQLLDRRKYSPIRPSAVDARTDSKGVFKAGSDLEVDATVKLTVLRWTPVAGKMMFRCDADLVMTHSSGVELYRCALRDGGIRTVDAADGNSDFRHCSNQIVTMLIEKLPVCPPLPQPEAEEAPAEG